MKRLVFLAALLPASATADEIHRTIAADASARVGQHAQWDRNCLPLDPPRIRMDTPPSHGTIETRPTDYTIRSARAGGVECIGRQAHGIEMVYRPAAQFHGVERFSYATLFDRGTVLTYDVTVEVR